MKIEINTCDCCNSILRFGNGSKGIRVDRFLKAFLYPNDDSRLSDISYVICRDCEDSFLEMTKKWISEVEDKRLNFRGYIVTNIIEKFEATK